MNDRKTFIERAREAGYDSEQKYADSELSGCGSFFVLPFLVISLMCLVGFISFFLQDLPKILTDIICTIRPVCY